MTTTTIKDEATCERKQSFSYARAQQVARQMRRCDDEPVIAYRCRACGKWHVGGDASKEIRKSYLKHARG